MEKGVNTREKEKLCMQTRTSSYISFYAGKWKQV